MPQLLQAIQGLSAAEVAVGSLLFLITLLGTLGAAVLVLRRLPADYFTCSASDGLGAGRPGWQRTAGRIGKNLLGAALVAIGVVLMFPGVPGQGLLTLLIGVVLLDFPGKRRLERRIARVPAVLRGLNRLRARFGKPPFTSPLATSQPSG